MSLNSASLSYINTNHSSENSVPVSITYHLYKFGLLLLFLQSMFAWFFWDFSVIVLLLAVSTTTLFAIQYMDEITFSRTDWLPVLFIVAIEYYVVKTGNANGWISSTFRILVLSILVLQSDAIKIDLFKFFTKAFGILLGISVLGWIIHMLGFSLPHRTVSFNEGQYVFDNYYLFLVKQGLLDSVIPRFTSVFLEPGQLGMITSFFLCANRFNLRNGFVAIILVATILTFSLVAYVLLLISTTAYFTMSSNKPIRNLLLWSFILLGIYFFFSTYKNGDNVFHNYIITRLNIENGNLTGNNRFSDDFELYYRSFERTNQKYFGIGPERYGQIQSKWEGGSAGYKVFIVQYGIAGVILAFLLYLSFVLRVPSKMAHILFLVYILCFIQAAYPLWECELFLFITALAFFRQKELEFNVSDLEAS